MAEVVMYKTWNQKDASSNLSNVKMKTWYSTVEKDFKFSGTEKFEKEEP